MSHFICTRCLGLAEIPGVCQTPDCVQNGEMLAECNCEDGEHAELSLEQKQGESDAEPLD